MARGQGQTRADLGRTLFGRDRELHELRRVVHSLTSGTGGVTLIVGEAGIGKSTLARAAVAAADELGVATLVTAGVPLTIGRPLQPLLDALDALDALDGTGAPGTATARTLLEATVGDPVTLLLQRVIDRFDSMAGDEPLLVVLEDLHWVDEPTLTFLHHHLTRADRRRLGIVATSRPPLPGTPLANLLASASAAVLPLAGLEPDAVDALLAVTLGGDTTGLDPRALAAAAGNPLLVEAIARSHRTHRDPGAAVTAHGAPVDPGSDPTAGRHHAGTPTDPITAAVRSLAPDVLSPLQIAAVAGTEIRVDLLTAIAGIAVAPLLDRLDRARTAGVIELDAFGDGYAFRHALYRSAVLDTLPASARAALHLEVARALDELGASTLEIAEHVAQGARPGNRAAVDQLTTAAEELAELDPSTALRITDLALDLTVDRSGRGEVPIRLQVVRVAALAACGRSAAAEALGSGLLAIGVAPEIEAKVRRELALAAFVAGRPADADDHMRRVVELNTSPEGAARAIAERAWARMLSLDRDGAWEGTDVGRRDGDTATRISAESLRCWLGLWRLDTPAATAAADHLEVAVGLRPRGDWQIFQPLLGAAAVRLEHEQFDRAIDNADAGRRLAGDAGSAWATAAYDALAASTSFRRGDFDLASTQALAALDGTAIVDSFGVEIWSRAVLAQIALRRGHVQLARHHIDAARLASEDGRAQLGIDHLVVAEMALHLADGDRASAIATLDEGWLFLSAVGIHFVRGIVGVELVKQLCLADERRADAEAIAAEVDHDAAASGLPLLIGAAARARAWLDRSTAAVQTAVDAAMASQNQVLRVDTLADAVTLAPGHASVATWSSELGPALTRMGCQPSTTSKRAAPSAKKVRPQFGIDALTDAERRVALLVAEGLTNAKIAAQLVISRRTVDTQVLAAYRKLGVSSRVGLTLALRGDTPG